MDHEDSLNRRSVREDEIDAQLQVFFRTADAPAMSADFVAKTMKAVRRETLPPFRRPLRSPMTSAVGWAAVVAGVALTAAATAIAQPVFVSIVARLVMGGVDVGVSLMHLAGLGLALANGLGTASLAVSRALATNETFAALMGVVAMGGVSLSALYKLLTTEGSERGVTQW